MSVSMRRQIAQNKRSTILIMVVFVAMITVIGWLFAWISNNPTLLITFFIISAAYSVLQYFMADRIAIATSGARQITRADNERYYRTVERLTVEADIPMPKVFIMEDPAPNAFATGRDPQHACIVVTSGLLEVMDDAELRAVIGHELSHIKNYDIRVNMIIFGLVLLVGFMSDFGLRVLFYGNRRSENNSPIGGLFTLIVIVLSPIAATIAQMGVSRQREYLADASSAVMIGNADDMIAALRKLDSQAQPMHQQNVATESMYIASPLRKSVLSKLFSTHPPIEARIERLENAKK